MSYASNWLNGIHENIQNRDAIESAKKEENRTRNRDKLLGFSMMIFGGVMMFIGLVDFFYILQIVWSSNIKEIISLISMTPNLLNAAIFRYLLFLYCQVHYIFEQLFLLKF